MNTTKAAPIEEEQPVEQQEVQVVKTDPIPQERVAKKEVKPEVKLTAKDNPNNCDTNTQYIREDNLECKDKPSQKQVPHTPAPKKVSQPTGNWVANCHAWASQAGVSLPSAAITLISRESKCNPTICNPNGIACGIPQALPFSKTGCSLSVSGAPCQIKWMQSYVMGRYGSWEAALAHSYANNWY